MTSYQDAISITCDGRERMYLFLSRIYREEMTVEYLNILTNSSSKLKALEDPELASLFETLNGFITKYDLRKEFIHSLAADYASLFLGIGKHPAHPYESVYKSAEKIVMQKQRDEVYEVYMAEGMQLSKGCKEPEDHIAIEFEFMGYMCRKTARAMHNNNADEVKRLLTLQHQFFMKHLSWIPSWCAHIEKGSAEFAFYNIMSKITSRFLEIENDTFETIMERLQEI